VGDYTLSTQSYDTQSTSKLSQGQTLGVRPENLKISETGLGGVIEFMENLGDATIVYLRVAGLPDLITLKLGQNITSLAMGQTIHVEPDPAHVLVFNAQDRLVH
jgi:ABC-type sugar transport system ATPase subunit